MARVRFMRRVQRTIKLLRRNKLLTPLIAVVCFVGIIGYAGYMDSRHLSVNPESYRSLLTLIGDAESNGNYNAYFGNTANQTVRFTDMTIAQVQQWQQDYLAQGSPSSAVGKYQIIDTTLAGLIAQLQLNPDQAFDATTQDLLAATLLENRGAELYLNNELSKEALAANLAMEWASLPKTVGAEPEKSYYADDGLNASRVTVHELLAAITPISAK